MESIKLGNSQLLPRTNEVRDAESAIAWLVTQSKVLIEIGELDVAFIFHNFIPASISAFSYAKPYERKVLLEVLWGLPESLYYNAHDKYIVDTAKPLLGNGVSTSTDKFTINKKLRFKHFFVAPDDTGRWVNYKLKPPFDWNDTIKDINLINKIALYSRIISSEVNKPLSIMWLVGVDKKISAEGIMPWHHELYDITKLRTHDSYRKKTPFDEEVVIRTTLDLEQLKIKAESGKSPLRWIRIQPQEDDLLRNKHVLSDIARIAVKLDAVIFLEGGILSHAYYQLQQTNAKIQVASLFQEDDELREFYKLVRDKIPDKIIAGGEKVTTAQFSGNDLLQLLKEKLVEEAVEVLDETDRDSIIEELADVKEIMDALLEQLQSNEIELQAVQKFKADKAGKFDKGFVLLDTANPHPKIDSNDAQYPLLSDFRVKKASTSSSLTLKQLEQKSMSLRRWSDVRTHNPEKELILSFEFPLVKSEWNAESPVKTIDLGQDFSFKVSVTGKRQSAKMNIKFSMYYLPTQLKFKH